MIEFQESIGESAPGGEAAPVEEESVEPCYVVRGSAVHGFGVFAACDIDEDETLLEYVGERITKEESDRRGQERLALSLSAAPIASPAIFFYRSHMARKRLPTLYLSNILGRGAPAHKVTAIPLKPASGILRMYPPFPLPFKQRLGGVY